MKKLFIPKNQIFNNDWMEFHLNSKCSESDLYYVRLCNRIFKNIPTKYSLDVLNDVENRKELVCVLVSYFEDIVSEIGIWQAFTGEHYRLYGKYLPFYKTGDDDYKPGLYNLQDIGFLLWHYISSKDRESLYSPYFSMDVTEILRTVMDVFDEEYETALENEELQNLFNIQMDMPVLKQRNILMFLGMKSYLNKILFDASMIEALEQMPEMGIEEKKLLPNLDLLMYDLSLNRVFNQRSPLLALRNNELLAKILGAEHPFYNSMLSVSEKKYGYFLYKGETATHIRFTHIVTGTEIDIIKESMDISDKKHFSSKMATSFGFVKWDNEYWQTGMASVFEYNPQELKKQILPQEYGLFNSVEEKRKVLKKQEKSFLKTNNGKHILFCRTEKDAETFLQKTTLSNYFENLDSKEKMENIVLFFNANSGLELYPDMAEVFNGNDEGELDLMELLCEDGISVSFINYILDNNLIDRKTLISEQFDFVWDDFDFLLRYFKANVYFEEPEVSVFDSSKSLIQ